VDENPAVNTKPKDFFMSALPISSIHSAKSESFKLYTIRKELKKRFNERVGAIHAPSLITDVAFSIEGGLEGAAAAFAGNKKADIYARPHNPTVRTLAETLSKLDSGIGAIGFSSGQAAIFNVILLLTEADTEVIVSKHVFGGTVAIGTSLLNRFGVTFKWADATKPETFEEQITDKTRLILIESVANPAGDIADFNGLSTIAKKHKIPLVVDNTTAPLLFNPFEHGADITVYSATKYLNGQANAAAGFVIDKGQFDWGDDSRYKPITAPVGNAPSFVERFGNHAFFNALQSQLTVDGSILAPEKANIIHENLRTLPERLTNHIINTQAVAEFLSTHKAVKSVRYAGLPTDPNHERAKQYLPYGVAGTILVTLKGGKEKAATVIENTTDAFTHAVNIGDANKNLINHPATTTHRQLSDSQKSDIGIFDGSLRLSIATGEVTQAIKSLDKALSL
jgi:O-acetylhomoserine (thiol)-lyase